MVHPLGGSRQRSARGQGGDYKESLGSGCPVSCWVGGGITGGCPDLWLVSAEGSQGLPPADACQGLWMNRGPWALRTWLATQGLGGTCTEPRQLLHMRVEHKETKPSTLKEASPE